MLTDVISFFHGSRRKKSLEFRGASPGKLLRHSTMTQQVAGVLQQVAGAALSPIHDARVRDAV
jgi:hypothetical protein